MARYFLPSDESEVDYGGHSAASSDSEVDLSMDSPQGFTVLVVDQAVGILAVSTQQGGVILNSRM
eukprot:10407947-Lingulodinium_polyedra.AAC.1